MHTEYILAQVCKHTQKKLKVNYFRGCFSTYANIKDSPLLKQPFGNIGDTEFQLH